MVGKVMGAPDATATMNHDHAAVGELTQELAALRSRLTEPTLTVSDANDLRRVLYGLYTLVKVHFAKEEEDYLPLLDARLTPDEAAQMFAAMHEAAHAVV
jgi:Hemerythrin HHE cation binding domain